MADELEKIVISQGEINSGTTFADGSSITVKSGGTLQDAKIPAGTGSLTLEAGAILSNTITIGVNAQITGTVDAGEADINLDLSDRKVEDGTIISNWNNLSSASSVSITVDAVNQDLAFLNIIVAADQGKDRGLA